MIKTKSDIIQELTTEFTNVSEHCQELNSSDYFTEPNEKWSIAQNIHHLILSTSPLVKALNLPKPVIRFFGKTTRPSMNYEELTEYYKDSLKKGGRATGRYVPKGTEKHTKSKSLSKFEKEGKALINTLSRWTEEQLDQYLIPHPLLGNITVREMLFFTIYHTQHHFHIIRGN